MLGRMLVDTHCHLTFPPLVDDLDGVLARARSAGVGRVVVPAYDLASWETVARVAERPKVLAALGLHPWQAAEDLDLASLRRALEGTGAVAVGEIGLDTKVPSPGLERQLEVLEAQLGIAAELGLPVILHCRGAFDELCRALERFEPRLRGVAHAYSRGPELARRLVDLGLHLGFGGAVTRPGARRARRSAQVVPLERIVLETDAPAIGLDGVEPSEAEPCHTAHVARALAELRADSVERVARVTTANAEALFGLGAG
jgi:TatD DNase family protein